MAVVTITFNHALNESLSIGDVLYKVQSEAVGNTGYIESSNESYERLGTVVAIDWENYMVNIDPTGFLNIDVDDFLFFAKDGVAETSSIIGYYAEVKFVNNKWTHKRERAELFSVGVDIFESSK